jgi:hypothetical protein
MGFLGARFGQWQVSLDLVAVAAAVFLLHHIAGLSEVADDAVGGALGDVQAGSYVAEPQARVGAMHSSTRAWLVRKLQSGTSSVYDKYFLKFIACITLQA